MPFLLVSDAPSTSHRRGETHLVPRRHSPDSPCRQSNSDDTYGRVGGPVVRPRPPSSSWRPDFFRVRVVCLEQNQLCTYVHLSLRLTPPPCRSAVPPGPMKRQLTMMAINARGGWSKANRSLEGPLKMVSVVIGTCTLCVGGTVTRLNPMPIMPSLIGR